MTSGESHGPQLTAIVSGLPAGLPVDRAAIDRDLRRRQGGYGRGGRMTIEQDAVRIVSGVRHGQAIGSPITLVAENRDWANWGDVMNPDAPPEGPAGAAIRDKRKITRPRPGHADLPGLQKFARQDARDILERASARATVMQVAVGALCKALLAEFGARVLSHVVRFGPIRVEPPAAGMTYAQIAEVAETSDLRVANPAQAAEIRALIDRCKRDGDTVGGVFEVVATGLPAGLGNVMNWDERLDGKIGQALMSLQAIKGVEIGMGFEAAARLGSQVHDAIEYSANPADWLDGHGPSGGFHRKTNGAGGLEGGMTNGEPLVARAAMKPIATLMRPIGSVDFLTKEPFDSSKERSDVCALPAAAVIGEALVAWVLAEAFLAKFGGDSLAETRRNYDAYVASLAS
jgi:chorismate synthase